MFANEKNRAVCNRVVLVEKEMVKEDQEAAAEVGKVPFFDSPIFFGIASGSIYFRCIQVASLKNKYMV